MNLYYDYYLCNLSYAALPINKSDYYFFNYFYFERFHKDPHIADKEKETASRSSCMTTLSSVEARLVHLFQKDFLLLLGILK